MDGVPRVRSPLSGWRVRPARAEHPFLVGFFLKLFLGLICLFGGY